MGDHGRVAAEIEDHTPLDSSEIDIASRIGWLLRWTRATSGVPLRRLTEELAARGDSYSPATLSRLEAEGRRSSVAMNAYETALGLPHGWLRAPIDVLCRTFAYAPPDTAPYAPTGTLAEFTTSCDLVSSGRATGPDWLRFAELHTTSRFGLPSTAIRPILTTLASELGRSVGVAYPTRYEALAKLRCSDYADVVYQVARAAVATPGAQVLNDLMSAVSENPTAELARWCGELLSNRSLTVMRAATLAIQNMRSVGGLSTEVWHDLAPVFANAYDAADPGSPQRHALAAALATCHPTFRGAVRARLTAPLEPVRRPAGGPGTDATCTTPTPAPSPSAPPAVAAGRPCWRGWSSRFSTTSAPHTW